ncbi:hypothetical protein EJB05_27500 [Eragrostis curvula]|uniref:Uncharacterized protein n=1 Tax=Eragrostis curvula TaxID=38414 RepID=A0A5J9UNJ9_9POAL|nr:hypothetical protein EJB05_27500 [Eragrostis curvula]
MPRRRPPPLGPRGRLLTASRIRLDLFGAAARLAQKRRAICAAERITLLQFGDYNLLLDLTADIAQRRLFLRLRRVTKASVAESKARLIRCKVFTKFPGQGQGLRSLSRCVPDRDRRLILLGSLTDTKTETVALAHIAHADGLNDLGLDGPRRSGGCGPWRQLERHDGASADLQGDS